MPTNLIRTPVYQKDYLDPTLQQVNQKNIAIENEVDRLGGFQGPVKMQENIIYNGINSANPTPGEFVTFGLLSKFIASTQGIIPPKTVTSNYAVAVADYSVFGNGTVTLTLPILNVPSGKTFVLKNVGSGIVTVTAGGAVNIDGATTFTLNPYQSIDVQWNGTQYYIL